MVNSKQRFREKSVARLSSPERLDQLMQLVMISDWLLLAMLAAIVFAAVGWSIWGRIPITVTGRGVLLRPYQTAELQVPVMGQIQQLSIKVGDRIRKGQVIGWIDRADIRQELQQQIQKLRLLSQQQQQLNTLTNQQIVIDLRVLRQKQQVLQQTIRDQQVFSSALNQNDLLTLQKKRQTLQQTLNDKQILQSSLRQQLQNRRKLQTEGAISADRVLEATQSYQENSQQISNLEAEIQDLKSKEIAIEQTYRTTLQQIADLNTQLQQIQSQEKTLIQRSLESDVPRRNQIQEVQQKIAQLKLQLQKTSQIISEYTGRIVELSAKPGQVVDRGLRLGLIETETPSTQLSGVLYFAIKDGKRIQPGMPLQITPDTVEREQYGGIVGSVKSVSAFPVTQQAVIGAVGNAEVAQGLLVTGGQMEVWAALNPDPITTSGYQWSSANSPDIRISPGTTASVRVTVDQQAPISIVLPFLESVSRSN